MNWRSLLCISDVCQQQRRYNQCRAKDCFARHGSLSFQCSLLRANGGGVRPGRRPSSETDLSRVLVQQDSVIGFGDCADVPSSTGMLANIDRPAHAKCPATKLASEGSETQN